MAASPVTGIGDPGAGMTDAGYSYSSDCAVCLIIRVALSAVTFSMAPFFTGNLIKLP